MKLASKDLSQLRLVDDAAQKTLAGVTARHDVGTAKLAEQLSAQDEIALEVVLGDEAALDKHAEISAEVDKLNAELKTLGQAKRIAEQRAEDASQQRQAAENVERINRCVAILKDGRDKSLKDLAEMFPVMQALIQKACEKTAAARAAWCGNLPPVMPGADSLMLLESTIKQHIQWELFRIDPTLPGAASPEALLVQTGRRIGPGVSLAAATPSLEECCKTATEFAEKLMRGERRFDGREVPKPQSPKTAANGAAKGQQKERLLTADEIQKAIPKVQLR